MEEQYYCNSIVSDSLTETNYEDWSQEIEHYLAGRGLWDIVAEGGEEGLHDSVWTQKNAVALHAILISCCPRVKKIIKHTRSANQAWTTLKNKLGEKNIVSSNTLDSYHMWRDPLFEAVRNGEWSVAEWHLNQNPEAVRARSPGVGSNVLQVAVTKEHLHIVELLMGKMEEKDLELEQDDGFTALALAIEVGNLAIAKCLVEKNKKLLSIKNKSHGIPVLHALLASRNHNMVRYLFYAMPINDLTWLDKGELAARVLSECIYVQYFDIALELIEGAPYLALLDISTRSDISPVYALAPSKAFPSACSLSFWQQWIYDYVQVPVPDSRTNYVRVDIRDVGDDPSIKKTKPSMRGKVLLGPLWLLGMLYTLVLFVPLWSWLDIKGIREKKKIHNQTSELLTKMCQEIKDTLDEETIGKARIHDALRTAACAGNVEFITSIVKANPSIFWNANIARTVFDDAIQNRQAKVFSLIYCLPNRTNILSYHDEKRNNMLHKAAALSPSPLRKLIPGAALQMQRGLQWFKAVEELASPRDREFRNSDNLKPRDLFTESHKDLVVEGEKWMKDTAGSCTVVGALIVTITFAAAFTFPGGNDQNNGFPLFLNYKLYRVFMMSNAVALFSSTTSVLMFLGILTSCYREEDFLHSLPRKLIIGLSTLFLSIAAMIIAFCVGLSLMFHNELWIVVPSICLAAIPISFFVLMQFPLLVNIGWSTYGPSIFDKKVKRWI